MKAGSVGISETQKNIYDITVQHDIKPIRM